MDAAIDAIRIDGLQVHAAGRCLLAVPALTVRAGERVALVGPNGAGKSTLLKVLGGFAPVRQGTVTVLGRSFGADAPLTPAQWRRLRTETGQVMQGLHLVPRLSALDNVVLGALARPGAIAWWRGWLRLYPAGIRREAQDALHTLGLAHRLQTRADRLSGGERQKAGIARLRLQHPRLILADEPTSALDPAATRQACEALLAAAVGATLLTVVHDPTLLPLLADRVIGLAAGRIVVDLPVHAVTARVLDRLYAGKGDGDGADAAVSATVSTVPAAPARPAAWNTLQPIP